MQDYLSRPGAEVLAQRIVHYWFARGFVIQTQVIPSSVFHDIVWVVRSDMLNGHPRGQRNDRILPGKDAAGQKSGVS